MEIRDHNPSVIAPYGAVKRKNESTPPDAAFIQDKVTLEQQKPLPRGLNPGNVPLVISGHSGSSEGTTGLASMGIFPGSDMAAIPPLLSEITLPEFGLPQELQDLDTLEFQKFLADNSRAWVRKTFVYDTREAPKLDNLKLLGSFDPASGQYDPTWNGGKGIAMFDDGTHGDEKAGDGLYSAQVVLDASDTHEFEWGVKADVYGDCDTPLSRDRWIMMTEQPPKFKPGDSTEFYAPLSNHMMGAHRVGDDGISFRTWSPEVGRGELGDYSLYADIYDDSDGSLYESVKMTKDEATGNWGLELPSGWGELAGKSYQYSVRNSKGETLKAGENGAKVPVVYSDPYSRYLQGQQRGLERIFVDPVLGIETGWYNDSGSGGPDYTINSKWARFTVNGHSAAESVRLILKDENGHQLTKKELLSRLGAPELKPYEKASPQEKRNVDVLRNWKVNVSGKVTDYKWTEVVDEDGRISMKKVGGGNIGSSWVTAVNNFPALAGLRYEFQIEKDGKILGDVNSDGIFQDGERKLTPFNDAYGNVITEKPGGERRSLIKESTYDFKYDGIPRKESNFRKYVIYEAHIGSFMSNRDNSHPCTFRDLIDHLGYLEDLGANTIELLPFNEFGGRKDWGYTPDFYFAGAESYGFEMPREEAVKRSLIGKDEEKGKESVWIHGTDAVRLFVDEAHKRGFNVFSDVVYNHVSGKADADNPLWLIDGDRQSFFKWWGNTTSDTPWGRKPNFGAQAVKDFYANNAAQQVEEFHLDGIRFDFTQVLHNTGSVKEKEAGMETLRQINRSIQFIRPEVFTYTAAEDFTHNWLVAADLDKSEWQGDMEKKGMGFSSVWNDSFHHDLLGAIDGSNPEKNMDRLMGSILSHKGVTSWDKAVVFSHSHDEVGNSGQWVGRAAAHSVTEEEVMKPYPRSVARSAAAITLTAAGVPMLFQGEEFMANNDFKHGITSTWGADSSWTAFNVTPDKLDNFGRIAALPPAQKEKEVTALPEKERALFLRYDTMTGEEKKQAERLSDRAGIFKSYKDLIALRGSSPAFMADSDISRVYTHNLDRVIAFERKRENEDYLVITNMEDMDRPGYKLDLPPGKWKEVFNTNARIYGGSGFGNNGANFEGKSGINLPSGSTIVLKKV